MDTLSMAFYAVVCGGLSALAPSFGGLASRVAVGGVTGLVAAVVGPLVHTYIGV